LGSYDSLSPKTCQLIEKQGTSWRKPRSLPLAR
jgi:hypothetical protein